MKYSSVVWDNINLKVAHDTYQVIYLMKTNNPDDLWVLLCPSHRKRIPYNEMLKRNSVHASAPICSRDSVDARIAAVRKELSTYEVQESKPHYYYHNVFSGKDVEVSEFETNELKAHGINIFTK